MRIGIDIDETLTDTEIAINEILKKNNIVFNKKYDDKWTKEEVDFIFGNFYDEIIIGAKIKKGAKEVLSKLKKEGHELFIITARNNDYSNNTQNLTYDFIKENKLDITEVYFDQYKKSDLAKKLNIDLMIDDNVNVYNNMKKDGIDCILFRDKIKTWEDVLKYIERKNNGENNN